MELTGKIKAKIGAGTFDGVPEDTEVTIFIPGMKKPIKAMLSDIEIEKATEAVVKKLTWGPVYQYADLVGDEIKVSMEFYGGGGVGGSGNGGGGSIVAAGGWSAPPATFYEMPMPLTVPAPASFFDTSGVDGAGVIGDLEKAIPGLAETRTACPECVKGPALTATMSTSGPIYWNQTSCRLIDVIVHLNDSHRWSREQIADWLEEQDWDLQFVTPEGATV